MKFPYNQFFVSIFLISAPTSGTPPKLDSRVVQLLTLYFSTNSETLNAVGVSGKVTAQQQQEIASMDFDQAKQCLLALLQRQGQAKNSELIAALDGDAALFARVREDLLFDDLAKDKKGVGLVYTGPVAGPPLEAPPAVPAPEEPLSSATPHAIFLSYGRADAGALAERLHADLQQQGHRVWLDQREIRTGADWEAAIERAILASEVFVALLSPHAVRRPDFGVNYGFYKCTFSRLNPTSCMR